MRKLYNFLIFKHIIDWVQLYFTNGFTNKVAVLYLGSVFDY